MTLFSGIYMRGRRKKCVSKSILIFGSVFFWLFLNSSPTFLSIYNHHFSVIQFFSHVFHTCQLQTVFSSLSTKKSLVNFHFFHSSLMNPKCMPNYSWNCRLKWLQIKRTLTWFVIVSLLSVSTLRTDEGKQLKSQFNLMCFSSFCD